jgi:acyl-[acyl-carrier-protein]-phospholipid O-acyltransferase/long-chain-fatty-acid--[acyl-carrier-protein] ligase
LLIAYRIVETSQERIFYSMLATGIFIMPYFFFSAIAGQLADKFDRAWLVRLVKVWEVFLMVLAVPFLYLENIPLLLTLLFLMGAQSAFFSPMKYSLLPQQLYKEELVAANAYIEAGTYLAILFGTIAGGLLILIGHETQWTGYWWTGGLLLILAVAGYLASRGIPRAEAVAPDIRLNWNFLSETVTIIRMIRRQKIVWRSILGISAFWLVGALYLAQLPGFCRDVLNAKSETVTFFLMVFSVGIGAGSLLCNRLLRGVMQTTYLPLGALGMAIFTFSLFLSSYWLPVRESAEPVPLLLYMPVPLLLYMKEWLFWKLSFDMFMVAVFGGIFTVPLYALVQGKGEPKEMARIIAGNNIINAVFMTVGTAIVALLSSWFRASIPMVFLWIALFNIYIAIYICRLLPDALIRSLVRFILVLLYRVSVRGLENYEKAGRRVLIIANHASMLDGVLIAAFMPEKVTFAINTHMARKWWMRPMLSLVNAHQVDPTNPLASRSLIKEIRRNTKVMIFPEGRVTVTGSLMKVYEGTGMIAEKSGAMILPVRIEGAQYSPFSHLKKRLRTRWFPKITLTMLPPQRFELPPDVPLRKHRQVVSDKIYDIMVNMLYSSTNTNVHLFQSLLNSAHINGGGMLIAEDIRRQPMSLRGMIINSYALGRLIKRSVDGEKTVGIMLPSSLACLVTYFSMHAYDLIPAMINFTVGASLAVKSCETAQVRTIITARTFIEQANLEILEKALLEAGIKLIYLEDVRHNVTLGSKAVGVLRYLFKIKPKADPSGPGTILFTSGSEGSPKAVVLSHRNLQANRVQCLSMVPITNDDRVFNCLPMFHSFGLSVGSLLPVLSGIRTFFYPSPLHYRIVSELCYDTNTSVIFGTDTFMSGYARAAHPYDFFNLRIAIVGAEKLRQQTREIWMEKFGVRLYGGYGTTETAPVVCLNTPMYNRTGSVGRAVPGLEYRLEPVEGVAEGGRLMIRGDNVMLGYYLTDNPGVLVPPPGGWYDTGDIAHIDGDGFIFIIGRAKRFAKISGEMISLGAVEEAVNNLWPDVRQGVVAIESDSKGEQIVLVTEQQDAAPAAVVGYFREKGFSELWIPKKIAVVKAAPLLGSGKFDYAAAAEIARNAINGNS